MKFKKYNNSSLQIITGRMSYWTCCVGYQPKKNKSSRRRSKKKDDLNLPDGFTCNGSQPTQLPTSPLFQNNNIFQQFNDDDNNPKDNQQPSPNTTVVSPSSNGTEKPFSSNFLT